ncbi:hypothetical protein KFE94_14915 [bacterium SCSIO 12643]|nr:hypothetical protein KFE94_14915 [bacterium SCSIO 12643]
MKKGLLLLAVAAFAFTGCDKVANIENFAISNTFEEKVTLDVTDADPNAFSKDFTIDAASDSDFKNNLSNISSYGIKKLTYRVSSFTGDDATTATGMAQFYEGNTAIGAPIDMGLISFKALANSGNITEISVSNELKKTIEQKLLDNNSITLRVTGVISNKPMKADFVISMEIEALVRV